MAKETKKCNKCGEVKPYRAYYKQDRCRGGVQSICRNCVLKAQKARKERLKAKKNRAGIISHCLEYW